MQLLHGDCLELLKSLPKDSIDLVLADPPYNKTHNHWDIHIKSEPLWKELRRVSKLDTPVVLFGTEPFSSLLRISNVTMYKYDWLWEKNKAPNFGSAKYNPLNYFENISVFYRRCRYFPIMEARTGRIRDRVGEVIRRKAKGKVICNPDDTGASGALNHGYSKDYDPTVQHPRRVLKFNGESGLHETQKPVKLLEYLIKTYTVENDVVLDFCMGSASTGIASLNLNRKFIGMELDRVIYETAVNRIKGHVKFTSNLI
jgi:site-specific DNA-methyltransferase (adenine-specific)